MQVRNNSGRESFCRLLPVEAAAFRLPGDLYAMMRPTYLTFLPA
jgi:hypothetical protein